MTQLFIVGGGGFGAEVAMICRAIDKAGNAPWETWAFLDDDPSYLRERGLAHQVRGSISDHKVDSEALYVCAIGDPATRRYICEKLEQHGARFTRVVHPVSQIDDPEALGPGTIVAFGGGVYPFAKVGRHVHINAHAGLGHDASVGDFVTLSAHVDITGGARIGYEVFLGSGARVLPNVSIGPCARIGAGCVIAGKIKPGAIVYAEGPKYLQRGTNV